MATEAPMVVPISLGLVRVFALRGKCTVLVDTGAPGSAPAILKACAVHHIEPEDIALILITHGHTDHTGAAAELKRRTGAAVAIHREDAEYLRTGTNPPLEATTTAGRLMARAMSLVPIKSEPLEPDLIINKEMNLEPYCLPGRIIFTPGHTRGSISLAVEASDGGGPDVFCGDLIAGQGRPKMNRLTYNLDEIKQSIQHVMDLAPRRIYAAHGGPFDAKMVYESFAWLKRPVPSAT